MDNIITILTYFVILSTAAERLTELLKTTWLAKLNATSAVYQSVAAAFGGLMAYLIPPPYMGFHIPMVPTIILVALAVSGGAGFWNSLLGILTETKRGLKSS